MTNIVGDFTVTIDGPRIGGASETTAKIQIKRQGANVIRDAAGDRVFFPHESARTPVSVSLPYSVDLPTDVASGSSEELGFVITVTTAHGGRSEAVFAAQASGSTINFSDLVDEIATPVSDISEAIVKADQVLAFGDTQDAMVAGFATDPTSDTAAALSATYARLPGPLGGWKAKLAADPANAKVVMVGSSSSDPRTGAFALYRRFVALHTQQGEALHGLASPDYFTDGVGNGTTTFTSAAANFTAADVGRWIHGERFPNSTMITAVTDATTITVSGTIPAGTGLRFWVGRHVVGGGNNGVKLVDWMADNPSPYTRAMLIADAPDLTIACLGTNDIKEGQLGTTVDTIVPALIALLEEFIDWHRAEVGGDLLLRMPQTLLSANVGGLNHVTDGTTVNPAGIAQTYSTALRRAHLHFVGKYPNVDVLDIQAEVVGTRSVDSTPLMADQLHLSLPTIDDDRWIIVGGGGQVAVADALAKHIGFARNAFPADVAQRTQHEFIVFSGPSAGTVRLMSRDTTRPAPEAPMTRADTLYVNGLDAPIALTTATISRGFSAEWLEVSGLGSTDFSALVGRTAMVASPRAPQVGEGVRVSVDLPSVAAGATTSLDVTVPNVMPGTVGYRAGVIPIPGSTFSASNLLLSGCYPKSEGVVKLVVHNPTGAAIDLGLETWSFIVVR